MEEWFVSVSEEMEEGADRAKQNVFCLRIFSGGIVGRR